MLERAAARGQHDHRAGLHRRCSRRRLVSSCRCRRRPSPGMRYRRGRCCIRCARYESGRQRASADGTAGKLPASLQGELDWVRAQDAADRWRRCASDSPCPRGRDGRPLMYLCGHSLGLAPLAARAVHLGRRRGLGAARRAGARACAQRLDRLRRAAAAAAGAAGGRLAAGSRGDEFAQRQSASAAGQLLSTRCGSRARC